MNEAKELLRLAKSLMGLVELSFEELKGAIEFSPKYIGGKNFWVKASPGGIFVRGPHGADYFREIRWRDRFGELRLRSAPQEVLDAFDYYGKNHGKLIKTLAKSGAFHTKRIARERMAVRSGFTVIKPLQLKREGATRDSLANADALHDAGYRLINGAMKFDQVRAEWEVTAYFQRKVDGADGVHIFKGFSFGYGGEGPHGLRDFLSIFGWSPKDNKILEHGYFKEERGNMNLKAFT